jgi:hypothetical protein
LDRAQCIKCLALSQLRLFNAEGCGFDCFLLSMLEIRRQKEFLVFNLA